jgi:inositol-hexakisphosphate kinase
MMMATDVYGLHQASKFGESLQQQPPRISIIHSNVQQAAATAAAAVPNSSSFSIDQGSFTHGHDINQPGHRGSLPPNVLDLMPPSTQSTRTNVKLPRSNTSPASPILSHSSNSSSSTKDVFAPQLSERDSIFATNYQLPDLDTPVASPQQQHHHHHHHERPGLISQAFQRHQLQQDQSTSYQTQDTSNPQDTTQHRSLDHQSHSIPLGAPMATSSLSPMRTSMTDLSQLFHTLPHTDLHHLQYPLASTSHRHSLYDPQLLPTLEQPQTPTTHKDPASSKEAPLDQLHTSAHRSSYRAWRQGQGRMAARSIAESQGRDLGSEDNPVDRKIDAKLPKFDQAVNVRSRKTSHYLGLFKDQDSEHEKKRDKKDKEQKDDVQVQDQDLPSLSAIPEHHQHDVATG